MSKSNCFTTTFSREQIHGSQTLLKSAWQHFYPNLPSIQDKLSSETCLKIISKVLGLFLNTMMADNIYSPHNWQKFPKQFQRQLSQKGKIIFGIFIAFLKSTWNFVYLEKKDQLHSWIIYEVTDSEKYS